MIQQRQQQEQRRGQQQDTVTVTNDGCDESKCVSRGLSLLSNHSFTCYGNGVNFPMMCADGYQPRVIDTEPSILDTTPLEELSEHFPWMYREDGGDVLLQYFTCCPPDLSADSTITRRCSDPTTTVDDNTDVSLVCNDNNTWMHPRQMKTNNAELYTPLYTVALVQSYMCCDSIIPNDQNTTTNFLDETECVPYHDDFFYGQQMRRNTYGKIAPVFCNFPDEDFRFPRPLEITDSLYTNYKCCKTGPALPPFVQDSAFKLTVYPVIVFSSIAATSCIVLILGLLIPFFMQLKDRTYQRAQRTGRRRSSQESQGSGNLRRAEPSYTTYNLYLVYLAIPDLIISLYYIGLFGSVANQKIYPVTYQFYIMSRDSVGFSITVAYTMANLYLNAVISYEVFILLRNSHKVQRHNPPSILKVTLQAAAVYCFSIILFIIDFSIGSAASKAYNEYDYEKFNNIDEIAEIWFSVFPLIGILPIGFLGCVCIMIWWRGYMSSMNGITARDKAMRELTWYFFRIVAVFVGLWLPALIIVQIRYAPWTPAITTLFATIQPIASTCMAMTKSDVKKYIFDLITLSYIRTAKSQERQSNSEDHLRTGMATAEIVVQ